LKVLNESYLNRIFEEKGDDWEEKRLGEVCNIIGGGTPSKKNDKFYIGNIPWATVRDMKTDKIRNTEFKITSKAVLNSSTNIIPKGNVICNWSNWATICFWVSSFGNGIFNEFTNVSLTP
jgi:restriction endonuclease S subunit